MKARKVILTVQTKTLHIDSIHVLLNKVSKEIEAENANGILILEDGDMVSWKTSYKKVKF